MSEMKCTVCKKQKHQLRKRKSKLMPDMTLYLCNSCWDGGFEPRFTIILSAQKYGTDAVAEYVKNRKYVGKEILGRDLIR